MEQRAYELAAYMIENGATVRAAAKKFGISKSTVHKDLTTRLSTYSPSLYRQVRAVLDQNKAERHLGRHGNQNEIQGNPFTAVRGRKGHAAISVAVCPNVLLQISG